MKSGEFEIVERLLQMEGFDINARDKNNLTPLHFAVQLKDSRTLLALCGHSDLDVNAEDMNGRTPLHYAVKAGLPNNVRILLERQDVEVAPKNCSKGPLHDAAELGNIEIMSLLVKDSRVDVNAVDGFKVLFFLIEPPFTMLLSEDMKIL